MSWLRRDDQRCLNRKIGQLNDREYRALDALHEYVARKKSGGNFELFELKHAVFVTPSGPRRVTESHLETFISAGLVDIDGEGFKVHDWDVYQPKDPTAADRMQRYRERNAARNGTVTDAVTESELDRDSRARSPSRPQKEPPSPARGGEGSDDTSQDHELRCRLCNAPAQPLTPCTNCGASPRAAGTNARALSKSHALVTLADRWAETCATRQQTLQAFPDLIEDLDTTDAYALTELNRYRNLPHIHGDLTDNEALTQWHAAHKPKPTPIEGVPF